MDTTQILVVSLATPAVSVLLFLLRRLEDGLPGAARDAERAAHAPPQAALRTRLPYQTRLTCQAVPDPRQPGWQRVSGPRAASRRTARPHPAEASRPQRPSTGS